MRWHWQHWMRWHWRLASLALASAFVVPPRSTTTRPHPPLRLSSFDPVHSLYVSRSAQTQQEQGPVDDSVIASQLAVTAVSTAAAAYWWFVTVPQKRLEVSRSKKSGDIKYLLDDLQQAAEAADGSLLRGDRKVERWLLSDWLDPRRRKEPALPILPKSKFNSGDNPILAAGALILAAGVANALAERASTLFSSTP